MAFSLPIDIVNRALQRLRVMRISSLDAPSHQAAEAAAMYDDLRLSEVRRNLWKFATRRVVLRPIGIDTLLWTPAAWVSGTSYGLGAVVSYTPVSGPYTGVTAYWQLAVAESSSTTAPDQDPNWKHYCGPTAVDLYNTGPEGSGNTSVNVATTYQTGEIALVPATYAGGTTYAINDVVNYNSAWYVSLTASNTGNQPDTSPTHWALWTSNGRGNGTYGRTATNSPIPLTYPGTPSIYISLYNNNADNPASGTVNWVNIGGTVEPLQIAWPLGTGPFQDVSTLNASYLPNGWLKEAPLDPKAGQTTFLGANTGGAPEDWVYEGNLLVTGYYNGSLTVRGVFDITDVTAFDPMFCEGLSARIALELCLDEQTQRMITEYNQMMSSARMTNAIEIGPIFPVENRYVTVRA